MKYLWRYPHLRERVFHCAAFSSAARPGCARKSRSLISEQHQFVNHVARRRKLACRMLTSFSSSGVNVTEKTENVFEDGTCATPKQMENVVKEITAHSSEPVGIFWDSISCARHEMPTVMAKIREFTAGKKETEFIVVSETPLNAKGIYEFELAGATVIFTRMFSSSKLLQRMYMFAASSPPASTIVLVSSHPAMNFFLNTFINQYALRVVYITRNHNANFIPRHRLQLVQLGELVKDTHDVVEAPSPQPQPSPPSPSSPTPPPPNKQQWPNLSDIEQDSTETGAHVLQTSMTSGGGPCMEPTKMEPEANVKEPAKMEPEVLVKEQAKVESRVGIVQKATKENAPDVFRPTEESAEETSSVVTVMVTGLPKHVTELGLFKWLDKQLVAGLSSEIRSINSNKGIAIVQFKNWKTASRGAVSLNKIHVLGKKLSATIMNDPQEPPEDEPSENRFTRGVVADTSQSSSSDAQEQQQAEPSHTRLASHPNLTQDDYDVEKLNRRLSMINERLLRMLREDPLNRILLNEIPQRYSKRFKVDLSIREFYPGKGSFLGRIKQFLHDCRELKVVSIDGVKYVVLKDSSSVRSTEGNRQRADDSRSTGDNNRSTGDNTRSTNDNSRSTDDNNRSTDDNSQPARNSQKEQDTKQSNLFSSLQQSIRRYRH